MGYLLAYFPTFLGGRQNCVQQSLSHKCLFGKYFYKTGRKTKQKNAKDRLTNAICLDKKIFFTPLKVLQK